MNTVALINCSPREKTSISKYLTDEIKTLINNEIKIKEWCISDFKRNPLIFNELIECKKLVFLAPLYVDALPANMVTFLKELETFFKNHNSKTIEIYTVINCGFIEGSQNVHAIEMMKIFTKKAGLKWGFGVGIGGGEFMGASKSMPLKFFIKKPVYNALLTLKSSLVNDINPSEEYALVSPKLSKRIFIAMGNQFWNSKAKTKGLCKKDLYNKYHKAL